MEERTEIVKAELTNGTIVQIQATALGGQEKVGFDLLPFKEVTDAIEGIAKSVMTSLEKVQPRKATVEFGLEIGVESGTFTAIIVKGTGTANIKITLEWGESEKTS